MTKDTPQPLRQWAIEQSIKAQAEDITSFADILLTYVLQGTPVVDDQSTSNLKTKTQQVIEERKVVWSAKPLTPIKQAVMQAMIKRFETGETCNGTQVAKDLKMTQSNASHHLRELVRDGYLKRQGNKWWPVKTVKGAPLPVPVYQMPTGVAKGYKPLQASIEEIVNSK